MVNSGLKGLINNNIMTCTHRNEEVLRFRLIVLRARFDILRQLLYQFEQFSFTVLTSTTLNYFSLNHGD